MRLLVVTQLFWPEEGGASTALRALARSWARDGHAVTVLTTRSDPHSPRRERIEGYAVVRLPARTARGVGTAHFLARTAAWIRLRRERFDAVCVSMIKYAALAALAGRGDGPQPVVVRTEGGGESGDVAWLRRSRFGPLVDRRCRSADAVVAINTPIRDELLAAGWPPERVRLIPNGVPIPARPWARDAAPAHRRELGLPEAPTLVFTGRLREAKGLHDLLRALPALPARLLLVGDGPERGALARTAREAGVSDRVTFAGAVSDVTPWLRASELFVLPSYVEGLSIALLEALALGMPAIASDIDANRGLLPESLLPLFPPRDPGALAAAARAALAAPPAPGELRRATSDRYGVDRVAAAYLPLFARRRTAA